MRLGLYIFDGTLNQVSPSFRGRTPGLFFRLSPWVTEMGKQAKSCRLASTGPVTCLRAARIGEISASADESNKNAVAWVLVIVVLSGCQSIENTFFGKTKAASKNCPPSRRR